MAKRLSKEFAIPIYAHGKILNSRSEYVKKIQCFCFEEQILKPYERQEWPVRFYVSSEVGDNVNDIYLSYTLFETDRVLTDNMNHGK